MAFRSSAIASSATGGTITATPSGVVANDYLGAAYLCDNATCTLNLASGYSLRDTVTWGAGGPDGGKFFYARKAAASGSDAFGFSDSNGTVGNALICAAWSGRDNATPESTADVTTTNTSSNASPISETITGITASQGDDVAVFLGLDQTAAAGRWTNSTITNYTEQQDGVATDWVSGIGLQTRDNVNAGATGSFSVTATNSGAGNAGYGGIVVAIKAAAASQLPEDVLHRPAYQAILAR